MLKSNKILSQYLEIIPKKLDSYFKKTKFLENIDLILNHLITFNDFMLEKETKLTKHKTDLVMQKKILESFKNVKVN